jgi:hypothetical protein
MNISEFDTFYVLLKLSHRYGDILIDAHTIKGGKLFGKQILLIVIKL